MMASSMCHFCVVRTARGILVTLLKSIGCLAAVTPVQKNPDRLLFVSALPPPQENLLFQWVTFLCRILLLDAIFWSTSAIMVL